MVTVFLFIIQLWNQPSVRLLGISPELSGYVEDPLTDINWNPAYIKMFGLRNNSQDALQFHSKMRSFWSSKVDEKESFTEFYENNELLNVAVLYPKIGVGCRIGGWQRYDDRRSTNDQEVMVFDHLFPELWLYGQTGILTAIPVTKWITVGVEYNYSWNNQSDRYIYYTYDTLGNQQFALIYHEEWSHEFGAGILLHIGMWEFSLAGKNNWEKDSYDTQHENFFWREGGFPLYMSYYEDLQVNSRVKYRIKNLSIIGRFVLFRKYKHAWNPDFRTISDYYRWAIKPGLGITAELTKEVMLTAAVIYGEKRTDSGMYEQGFSMPLGFEYAINEHVTFRFGNTFEYAHVNIFSHKIWNQFNIGVRIAPIKKLKLDFATQLSDEYTEYWFGLFFSL